jgi:hypothetical protein
MICQEKKKNPAISPFFIFIFLLLKKNYMEITSYARHD